jgi:hypothetical protein
MRFLSFRRAAAALAMTFAAAPALAAGEPLTAGDIRHDIIGHTIYLAAPVSGEFPLNYHANGVVDGDGEALGLGRFVAPKDTGRWWISGDKLCQKFTTWYDGAPMCFDLTREDAAHVKWVRDNGETGVARIAR